MAVIGLLLPVLGACVANPPVDGQATPAPEVGVDPPLTEQISLRISQDVSFLRPWEPRSRDEELIIGLLYNGLMRIDVSMRAVPDLAAGVSVSDDGKTLTFTLLPGLRWHDSTPLTSADVA